MPTACLIVFIVAFAAQGSVRAEMWTNQAGRVIEAKLGEFDGTWITLVRTNGATLKLPLSALREADQHRVRRHKAQSIAPSFVMAAYLDAVTVLRRFDRLPADQRTTESWQKAVQMAYSIFDARISVRSAEITDNAVRAEIRRIRAALANGVN